MGLRENARTPEQMAKTVAYQKANGIGHHNRLVLDSMTRKKKLNKKKKKLSSKSKRKNR